MTKFWSPWQGLFGDKYTLHIYYIHYIILHISYYFCILYKLIQTKVIHSWSYSELWLSYNFVPKSHHSPRGRKFGVRDTRREIMNWWINKQRRGRQTLCEQDRERHRGTLDISIRHPCLLFITGLNVKPEVPVSRRERGRKSEDSDLCWVQCVSKLKLQGDSFNTVSNPWD